MFKSLNTIVIGVSKDSLKSHENFAKKRNILFALVSDEDGSLCELFGVIKQKSMYGKTYLGIERSTFIFDENAVLVKEYRGVKVKGHVDEVISFIKSM